MGATNPNRLLILHDRLAVIQSGDRLLLSSLNGKYNSVIPLKSPLDRFLAIARIPQGFTGPERFIAVTASGLLEIKIDIKNAIQGNQQ
jgi:nuclear pore complex protein Nup133